MRWGSAASRTVEDVMKSFGLAVAAGILSSGIVPVWAQGGSLTVPTSGKSASISGEQVEDD